MSPEYIKFEPITMRFGKPYKGKTKRYDVINKKSNISIGIVKWHPPWRKYCYFPYEMTAYDVTCMNDIANFITELMKARK